MKEKKIKLEIEDLVIARSFDFYGNEIEEVHQYSVFKRKPILWGLFHVRQYIGIHVDDKSNYLTYQVKEEINSGQEKPRLRFRWMKDWKWSTWDERWENFRYVIMKFYNENNVKEFIKYIEENPDKMVFVK